MSTVRYDKSRPVGIPSLDHQITSCCSMQTLKTFFDVHANEVLKLLLPCYLLTDQNLIDLLILNILLD